LRPFQSAFISPAEDRCRIVVTVSTASANHELERSGNNSFNEEGNRKKQGR
jgi:hypothetical protein